MPSDFDKTLAEAEARRDAAARAERDRMQEEQRRQRVARSIAEPHLRQLASEVATRLREQKVPLVSRHLPNQKGGVALFRREPVRRYWDLSSPSPFYVHLYLTNDENFVQDYRQSGRDGFEEWMQAIFFSSDSRFYHRSFYVDHESRDLMIQTYSWDTRNIRLFDEWLAERVLVLLSKAGRHR